jgi:hypothetical membrane protein
MTRRTSWPPDRIALLVAVALTGASITLYPGGTFRDESANGYSFTHNFLSDLGGSVAFNYQRNLLGAVLFGLAMVLGVFALGACIVASVRVLSPVARARPFARLAAVAAVLVCVGYLGVAASPQDRLMGLHQASSLTAVHAFPVLTMLLAAATMRDNRFRRRATVGWVVLSLVLAGFLAVGHFGPGVQTDHGLTVQVLAQKVMASAVIVVLWLESHEIALVRSHTNADHHTVGSMSPSFPS